MSSIGRKAVLIASFRLFPVHEQRRQVIGILQAIQGPTRAQAHCISCQLFEERGYDESILYVEQWDSEVDFQRHVRSDFYRQALEAAELSRRVPEIQFYRVSETRGIDLLEELRAPFTSAINHRKQNGKP